MVPRSMAKPMDAKSSNDPNPDIELKFRRLNR
jgi:hypothetical protein